MQSESDVVLPEWVTGMVSALDTAMGLRLSEVSRDRVAGSMPVQGNTQPHGLWHGGASAVLIETLASLTASAIGHPDRVGVGVDLNVTHLRPTAHGRVHGYSIPLRVGRRTVTCQVELSDDQGRAVAVGRLTCQLAARPTE